MPKPLNKRMNPKVKAKLIAALTSGKYKQAQGALRTRSGYCCLGVLCDLYAKEHPRKGWRRRLPGESDIRFGVSSEQLLLPIEVQEWSGITKDNGEFYDRQTGNSCSLVELNDNGHSFDQIAKTIKRYF